jgi:hypothetical protein
LEKSWDNFALSVVFYQLLFGLHPYAVTPKFLKDANSSEISTNISDDLFPFGANAHKIQIVPPLHDKFKILPQEIRSLFIRSFSFNTNQRPNADEWGKNIHKIIHNAGTIPDIPIHPPKPPTPQPKPQPTPKIPESELLKPPTGTGGSTGGGGKTGCVWLFVVLAIIGIVILVANAQNRSNSYNYQDNTTIVSSGDNEVIVSQNHYATEAMEEEIVETHTYYERVIFSDYIGENVYCNGLYPYGEENAQYFSVNLGSSLNRNYFKISSYFWTEEHKNQWALMLSDNYRILGINLDNGNIYISTNKHGDWKYHNVGTYQLDTWNYISLEYDHGKVRVNNGDWFSVDINTTDGDNVLSSINYASGIAFKGYLSNIEVITYN